MKGEHFICEGSRLAGKSVEWIRKNIEDLVILSVKPGLNGETIDNSYLDEYKLRGGDYIKIVGTPESTLKLINMSIRSYNN